MPQARKPVIWRRAGRRILTARSLIQALGVAGWTGALVIAVSVVALSEAGREQSTQPHFDWRVYAAGADQLFDRTLYQASLPLPEAIRPVERFNLPPLAALEAAPLRILPSSIRGVAWQLAAIGSTAAAAWLVAAAFHMRHRWTIAGIVAGLMTFNAGFPHGLLIGNNNLLMLGITAGAVFCYQKNRDTSAGLLLGIAVSTKLWPAFLFLAAARERRWTVVAVGAAFLAAQGIIFVLWLGPDRLPEALSAFGLRADPHSNVIGISALRQSFPDLPAWFGPLVAIALLALPLKGAALMGSALLAGIALVPNQWVHYLPLVVLAVILIFMERLRIGRWLTSSVAIDDGTQHVA